MAAGALVYALLLNPVDYVPSEPFRWLTASLPSMAVAGGLYWVLSRTVSMRLGQGGFTSSSD